MNVKAGIPNKRYIRHSIVRLHKYALVAIKSEARLKDKTMKSIKINDIELYLTPKQEADLRNQLDGKSVIENGTQYWYIFSCDEIDSHIWDNDKDDNFLLLMGNFFLTREEAEAHLAYLVALTDVNKYIRENDLAKEWVKGENNYYVAYDTDAKIFKDYNTYCIKDALVLPSFKSLYACKQLIKEKEKELKIIFKVK